MTLLCIGTPLIFTPLTRSVFEVNKLLLLRIVTLIILALWSTHSLLNHETKNSSKTLWNRWKSIGLEKAFIAWFIINLISTALSQNFIIGIIGAYDRWEGIITITNYIFLYYIFAKQVTKQWQLPILLFAIVGPTFLSSLYGIFQSLGLDFMAWSKDPTRRVFACINNPVHFCAYVGMVMPVAIGWLFYLSSEDFNTGINRRFRKWFLFLSTLIIYYTQFLSFSRATWMAFVGSMTLFYLVSTNRIDNKSHKDFFIDFLFTGVTIGALYLTDIFKLHHSTTYFYGAPTFIIIFGYLAYRLYKHIELEELDLSSERNSFIVFLITLIVIFFNFSFSFSRYIESVQIILLIQTALSITFITLCMKSQKSIKTILSRLVIILLFAKLQYVQISLSTICLYFVLVYGYYVLELKSNASLIPEKKQWLISYLLIFALIIILPTLPLHLKRAFNFSGFISDGALKNVEYRVKSYEKDALEGTARTSMWKSSVPWIKDYFLFGSGPDTIKYLYPTYRLPDYGILEGGHNFTPDRLHNEYLNTFATRGVIGFVIYYIAIIGGWLWIVLKSLSLFTSTQNNNRYILAGTITGSLIYLGQVLFNFGVVATLVLFYIVLGLSHALSVHSDFKNNDTIDQES